MPLRNPVQVPPNTGTLPPPGVAVMAKPPPRATVVVPLGVMVPVPLVTDALMFTA
ncbi:hypothetical protein D3C86_2211640 [compost metagenome]